jgi:hypothetical protein
VPYPVDHPSDERPDEHERHGERHEPQAGGDGRVALNLLAQRLLDLPGMLAVGRLPLRVLLHARRVGDLQLAGQVVDDLGRHPLQRSARNLPTKRAVASWTLKPSRL